jgi:hypothetical protein
MITMMIRIIIIIINVIVMPFPFQFFSEDGEGEWGRVWYVILAERRGEFFKCVRIDTKIDREFCHPTLNERL